MPRVPFAAQFYQARDRSLSSQRVVNLYGEKQMQGAKAGFALYGTPGATSFLDGLPGETRGALVMEDVLYVVAGNQLFSVDSAGSETSLGAINTNVGLVGMAKNAASPAQLCIVDGSDGWIYDTSGGLQEIVDGDFLGAEQVAFLDQYFIFPEKGGSKWFISDLNDGLSYTATNFATAESAPDRVVAIGTAQRRAWVFGELTTEAWFNAGGSGFPFQRETAINVGCIAKWSAARVGSTMMWLGNAQDGDRRVYIADGFQARAVSTPPINEFLRAQSDVSDAEAFVYGMGGHTFYVLNLPSAPRTFVFDLDEGIWHERDSRDGVESLGRWRARVYAFAYNKHLIGDYAQGRLGELDLDVFTEYGNAMIAEAVSVPYAGDSNQPIFFNALELDIESGVGLTTGQGDDPQIVLSWSNDGGRTWEPTTLSRSMGKIGEYKKRALWRRLGRARERVFKIYISDPVKRTIKGGILDIEGGIG